MIAAKAFDPVMGVDIHIIQPPGPVPPVPIPHPFIGMLVDPMDFAPVIGATVMVNGMPRATAGTGGKCIPPHIPIGGVFVKPPASECEIFMGSSTVLADGDPLSFLGMPCLSCHDVGMPPPPRPKKKRKTKSLTLPTSVVLAVPAGGLVLVGGPPTVSMMALGMKAAMAGLGKAFKKLRRLQRGSRRMKALSDRAHAAARRAMDRLGVPPNVQNRVHRALCTATGHPVDVATGKVFTDCVDFELPGPIPLRWQRVWYSCSVYAGPLGYGWHHSYDMALWIEGPAVAVRLPDGRSIACPSLARGETHFDRKERLTLLRDSDGYAVRTNDGLTWSFRSVAPGDPLQRLITISDRNGSAIVFAYSGGVLAGITDSAGRQLAVRSDDYGRITQIVATDHGNAQPLVTYDYSAAGDLGRVLDPLAGQMQFEYSNHLLIRETNKVGYSYHFRYDGPAANARCVHTWGDDGSYNHKITYDLDMQRTTVLDSYDNVERYDWNDQGLVVRLVDGRGGETTLEYNEYSEMLGETDALGQRREYQYDDRGNQVASTMPDGGTISIEYSDDVPVRATNEVGGEWKWEYDRLGRMTRRVDPANAVTEYSYTGKYLNRISEPSGAVITVVFDGMGNLVEAVDSARNRRRWVYDTLGRCIEAVDANGLVQRRAYDALGRVIRVIEIDGDVRTIEYDAESRMIRATNRYYDVSWTYTGTGLLVSRRQGGDAVRYEHDLEGRLVKVVNEAGEEYSFELNAAGDVVSESDFGGLRTDYEVDLLGRNVGLDRCGAQFAVSYDPVGRLLRVQKPDGSADEFSYRLDGHLMSAVNSAIAVTFERDMMGRVTLEQQGDLWLRSAHDSAGRRTLLETSLGLTQTFKYDTDPQPQEINARIGGSLAWSAVLSYDPVGYHTATQTGGRLRNTVERDQVGRPIIHSVDHDAATVDSRRFTWEVSHRLLEVAGGPLGSTRYGHDVMGQLAGAKYEDGSFRLRTMDRVGNPYRTVDLADRKYGAAGELLRAGSTHFRYDDFGQLIEKEDVASARWTYGWNNDGMLTNVQLPDGRTVSFLYDALGRRLAKRTDDRVVRWVWDEDVIVHEVPYVSSGPTTGLAPVDRTQGDVVTWVFSHNRFTPLARIIGAEPADTVICDYLGTPFAMFAASGEKVWAADLDPYGEVMLHTGSRADCPFRYPGQYEDEETGLYYNRYRYYDPAAGVYISRDPIGLLGGDRLYAYVKDPLTWTDIFGLTGVVYLRTDPITGREYVGQSKSPEHFQRRQRAHNRRLQRTTGTKAQYDFQVLQDNVTPGSALRKAEEDWIRAGGGPGALENRRYEMNDPDYRSNGGKVCK